MVGLISTKHLPLWEHCPTPGQLTYFFAPKLTSGPTDNNLLKDNSAILWHSSRACQDVSEDELSFVRRPWIFGVWHNNSGWSHTGNTQALQALSERTGSAGIPLALPRRPHPPHQAALALLEAHQPLPISKEPQQSQLNPNDWVCMGTRDWQGLSTKPPRPNKEGSEGFIKTGKRGPREAPHVTQLVKGEIA